MALLNPSNGLCQCGCGQPAPLAKQTSKRNGWTAGKPVRFISGHNRKGKGKKELSYNRALNRWVINCRDGTRYYWHRAVASNEVGYLLPDYVVVHHQNGDQTDDRPENLEILDGQSEHARLHGIERGGLNGSQSR